MEVRNLFDRFDTFRLIKSHRFLLLFNNYSEHPNEVEENVLHTNVCYLCPNFITCSLWNVHYVSVYYNLGFIITSIELIVERGNN